MRLEVPVDADYDAGRRIALRVYDGDGACALAGALPVREALRGAASDDAAGALSARKPRTLALSLAPPPGEHDDDDGARRGTLKVAVSVARRVRIRLCEADGLGDGAAFCATLALGTDVLGETRPSAPNEEGASSSIAWYDRFDVAVPCGAGPRAAGPAVTATVFKVVGDAKVRVGAATLAASVFDLAARPGLATVALEGLPATLEVHVAVTDFGAATRLAVAEDRTALEGAIVALETRPALAARLPDAIALLKAAAAPPAAPTPGLSTASVLTAS